MRNQSDRHRDRQQSRRVVVWGCDIHQTPAGETCQGCYDQGELFSRADASTSTRRTR